MNSPVIAGAGLTIPGLGTQKIINKGQVTSLRWLTKPDGTVVLQQGFPWRSGTAGGIEWEDVPTIIEEKQS